MPKCYFCDKTAGYTVDGGFPVCKDHLEEIEEKRKERKCGTPCASCPKPCPTAEEKKPAAVDEELPPWLDNLYGFTMKTHALDGLCSDCGTRLQMAGSIRCLPCAVAALDPLKQTTNRKR
jgi:hypothetical protein